MSKVSRNDLYVSSEKGGDWFEDFLKSFAKSEGMTTKDISDAINNKREESIESVVQSYRDKVGLDIVVSEEVLDDDDKKPKLSVRQAQESEYDNVVDIIENSHDLKTAINSFLEHSGGTKKVYSIISFLRDRLGKDVVSYSDSDLVEYINNLKSKYSNRSRNEDLSYLGLVGVKDEYHDDEKADYATNTGAK